MPGTLFVTGKLARDALTRTLAALPDLHDYRVLALDISVAALMNTRFLLHQLQQVPDLAAFDVIMLPGLCRADLDRLEQELGVRVRLGPSELKDLPAYLGAGDVDTIPPDPGRPAILGEIVDAPLLTVEQILDQARHYAASGADFIDLGCTVDTDFPHLERAVAALRGGGFRVSIDSFSPEEIRRAVNAGAELVLSLNGENLHLAGETAAAVVIIPDAPGGLDSLEANLTQAQQAGARCIVDPILDPLGCGFVASIERYAQVRRRHTDTPILMGIGNVTELTDADSTGLNALLMGIAAELDLDYVLTTEAGPRTRGAVREAALARHLVHQALFRGTPPKNLSRELITVKDLRPHLLGWEEIKEMQSRVSDRNFRIFVAEGQIVVFNRELFLTGKTAEELFSQTGVQDPGHAFYLGRELAKAELALQLGKRYVQEQPLTWGYLDKTQSEE